MGSGRGRALRAAGVAAVALAAGLSTVGAASAASEGDVKPYIVGGEDADIEDRSRSRWSRRRTVPSSVVARWPRRTRW